MIHSALFNSAPLPTLLLATFALLALSAALGNVTRRALARTGREQGEDATEGYLLSATLALLGLLISFTFAMALSRYEARREAVVVEANAIGTAWLRAGLAQGPAADALHADLRAYAKARVRLPGARDANRAEDEAATLQQRVWADLARALPAMQTPAGTTLINAVNEMFDAASSRRAEREARIPALVLDLLLASGAVAAGMIGYVQGHDLRRHGVVTALLFVLITIAFVMILDLDRPWSGMILVPQAPMEQTVAAMR